MIIAVDIDDTLAELQKSWLDFYNKKYGYEYIFEEIKNAEFDYIEDVAKEEVFNRLFEFYNTKEFDELNTVFGAVEAIEKLSKKHELIIISAREKSILEKSKKWLNKNFPNKFSKILHMGDYAKSQKVNKSDVARELGVHVFIEDNLVHANELANSGIKVLLLDKPWNREPYDSNLIRRMISWKEVNKTVKNF